MNNNFAWTIVPAFRTRRNGMSTRETLFHQTKPSFKKTRAPILPRKVVPAFQVKRRGRSTRWTLVHQTTSFETCRILRIEKVVSALEGRRMDRSTRKTCFHGTNKFQSMNSSVAWKEAPAFQVRTKDRSTTEPVFNKKQVSHINNNFAWHNGSRVSGEKEGQLDTGNTFSRQKTSFTTWTNKLLENVVTAFWETGGEHASRQGQHSFTKTTSFQTWTPILLEKAVPAFWVRRRGRSTGDTIFHPQTRFKIWTAMLLEKSGSRVWSDEEEQNDKRKHGQQICSKRRFPRWSEEEEHVDKTQFFIINTTFNTWTAILLKTVPPRSGWGGRSVKKTLVHQKTSFKTCTAISLDSVVPACRVRGEASQQRKLLFTNR